MLNMLPASVATDRLICLGVAFPSPTTSQVATALGVIAALCFIMNQALTLWHKITGGFKEQPFPASTYRTREDCNDIHPGISAKVEQNQEAMHKQYIDLRNKMDAATKELRTDIGAVHERINDLFAAVVRDRKG